MSADLRARAVYSRNIQYNCRMRAVIRKETATTRHKCDTRCSWNFRNTSVFRERKLTRREAITVGFTKGQLINVNLTKQRRLSPPFSSTGTAACGTQYPRDPRAISPGVRINEWKRNGLRVWNMRTSAKSKSLPLVGIFLAYTGFAYTRYRI